MVHLLVAGFRRGNAMEQDWWLCEVSILALSFQLLVYLPTTKQTFNHTLSMAHHIHLHHKPTPTPIDRVIRPVTQFMHADGATGILLIICTAIAMAWANSPWSASYIQLWETHVRIGVGELMLDKSLHHWINDGLMAVFFFLVGLEIKREVLVGELATMQKAALPIAAALGGMLIPAAIYVAFNSSGEGKAGWGIPMATDIAFALGVLSLLGKRIPPALTVFLAALAIADDMGAVMVIAIFYTSEISLLALAIGLAALIAAGLLNRAGVRHPGIYAVVGVICWIAVLKSGIHATVAGVLMAMAIPARTRISTRGFVNNGRKLLDEYEKSAQASDSAIPSLQQNTVARTLEIHCEQVQTPLQRLERGLHGWVGFFIMPIFALANAGIIFDGNFAEALTHPVTFGVAFGLIIGKPIGITLLSWLAIRFGWGAMPDGVTWQHVYGAAWLGGIGFTMSLFVGGLAFGESPLMTMAKVGILAASIICGVVGWLLLRRIPISAAE